MINADHNKRHKGVFPDYEGIKDLVLCGEKIQGIYNNIKVPTDFIKINLIDGSDKILFPGFIDSHVHINGAGGEGGFKRRTPEIKFSDLTKAGITTFICCIGTDGVCRDMRSLIAKANALEEEGITDFCYTGSYDIPVKTITDSIQADIMMLDKMVVLERWYQTIEAQYL